MPYKSNAQRKYFHYLLDKGKISPKVVSDFDNASRGLVLPEKLAPKPNNGWRGLSKKKSFDKEE